DEEPAPDRAHQHGQHRAVADMRNLDGDLVQPPREGEQQHDRDRETVDRKPGRLGPRSLLLRLRLDRARAPSSALASSKPSRFQLWRICGGSGAVTSMTPPFGWGMTMRRACRCKRF